MYKTHNSVIENFILRDKSCAGSGIFGKDGILFSRRTWSRNHGGFHPLVVRTKEGRLLVNGNRSFWPDSRYQDNILRAVQDSKREFGVVPFDSITAALTAGKISRWSEAQFQVNNLIRRAVGIAVPSQGEKWRTVTEKDENGKVGTRKVHTLGESVVKIRDRYYLSTVDETAWPHYNNRYFLIELLTRRAPSSYEEAVDLLKPEIVREAERAGKLVLRQGEWFAIPSQMPTGVLLAAVARGVADLFRNHVLGTDGHHQVEEAVIFKAGPRKGEVYARGEMSHTQRDHNPLYLGTQWHRVVHNNQGQSYNLNGGFD